MLSNLWNRFRSVVSNLKSREPAYRDGRPNHRRGTVLHAECLEQRQMLSANQISLNTSTSTLVVTGSSTGANTAQVWTDASNVVHVSLVTSTETLSATFARASVTVLQFVGGSGDDHFENDTNINCFANAGAGNDVLIGGTGTNYFLGGTGNDQLTGNILADTLMGDDGNDVLSGGGGNDQLEGATGDDTIYGGAGDDNVLGGGGNDTLNGDDGNDWIAGDIGNDVMHGGTGDDWLLGADGTDQLYGDDGIDNLLGDAGDDFLVGGAGNDMMTGSTGIDVLFGGLGDDALYGNDGNDQLSGEDGNDYLEGGNGVDSLDGGIGNDNLVGGLGNDYLIGGDGNDTLNGQDDNDSLDGGAGIDNLSGEVGDDVIHGGAGDDSLIGGDGNDQLYGDDGNDWLAGEGDNDQLIGNNGNDRLEGGVGDDTLYGSTGDDQLVGGDGNDALFGAIGNDWLHGGAGDDVIRGASGDDTMLGAEGNDQLYGDDGVDTLYGDDGNDYLEGGADNDQVNGGTGIDVLFGGLGDDALYGNDGNDQLSGEDGNDYLEGGNGVDSLDGGIGNDNLVGGLGNDYLIGGDGNDTLNGQDDNDSLDGGAGIDNLSGEVGDDVIHGGAGDDSLIGGDGNDQLYGDDGNDWLAGEGDNDQLIGNNGNDRLEGGVGDDTLYGSTGDDQLVGGDGNDALFGAIGNDWLHGGAGDDVIRGASGDDTMLGAEGNDQLYGDDGVDTLYGDDGNDYLVGANGNDHLEGGIGDDVLSGGAGDDVLYGVDGADLLWGDDGNDHLESGAGRAVLLGGAGIDQLVGGANNDVLIGGTGKDSLGGNGGDDILIGGSTDYDNDITTLRAVAAAWNNGAPYATRVQTITDALFTANLSSGDDPTVHTTAAGGHIIDDQVSDSLVGGNGQDWFLETGYMPMYLPSDVDSPQQVNVGSLLQCGDQVMYLTDQVPALDGFSLFDSLDTLTDRQTSETLTSLIPKADSLSLEKEHLALMQLVRYDQVTNYAVRSGNWSDPTIWHGGIMPNSGARVLIPVGVKVNVDGMIPARLATVCVDGTLSFDATRNTQLQVDTLIVSDCGEFEMGTAEAPIARGVTARLLITDNGAIDRAWDPFGISRGLIAQGSVSMYGAQVDSYTAIAGSAVAGTQTLALKTIPIGWKAGDSVDIAGTSNRAEQTESRQILSIVGNIVTLDRPLTYSHVAASASFDVHIANTTRNAVIESETTTIDRRGHVMFMHNRDVNIAYAGFYKLGRTDKSKPINDSVVQADWTLRPGTGTNQRARYAVHFHRDGIQNDGNPAVITGSAVVDSPGWGFVNHSSNVAMSNNVAFGVNGAAFTTEVGDEIGSFTGNLAIGTTGVDDELDSRALNGDFGFNGTGFWFQGGGVSVTGNISAGNHGEAYVYYTQGLFEGGVEKKFLSANLVDPSIAQGAPYISVNQVPIRQFTNNIGYASEIGLRIRYHLRGATQGQNSLVENSTFWNNDIGVMLVYAENVTLRNDTIVTAVQPAIIGVHSGPLESDNLVFDNLTVSGYTTGINMVRRGTSSVIGGTFNNYYDIVLATAAVYDRHVLITGQTGPLKIKTEYDVNPQLVPGYTSAAFLVKDEILLNFGPFVNQRLYNVMQLATSIPFPTAQPNVPANYVGLTNQQLWNLYGVALGGEIAPNNFTTVSYINGLIGPRA